MLASVNYLGLLLITLGVHAAAELLLCKALEGQRQHLGSRQPHTHGWHTRRPQRCISNAGLLTEELLHASFFEKLSLTSSKSYLR